MIGNTYKTLRNLSGEEDMRSIKLRLVDTLTIKSGVKIAMKSDHIKPDFYLASSLLVITMKDLVIIEDPHGFRLLVMENDNGKNFQITILEGKDDFEGLTVI